MQPYEVSDRLGEDPEAALLVLERRETIQRLLETLPAHYRLVIVLRYWHDLSYREIAQVTRLSEAAVKTRLHRARRMLAAQLLAHSSAEEPVPTQRLPERVRLATFALSAGVGV
jgi:RNA polymerase sigma-70 factor (ECF subfamily)